MLACTHLLGSCHQQRQDTEMRRVRAHCTNCEVCTGNRCLVSTLQYVEIWLLSSSLSLPLFVHLLRVVVVLALITDARAHFDNCEQWFIVFSHVGSFGTVCPSVVSCVSIEWYILRLVAALSCASALLLDKNAVVQCACCSSLTNVRHHRHVSPTLSPIQKVFRFPTDEHV